MVPIGHPWLAGYYDALIPKSKRLEILGKVSKLPSILHLFTLTQSLLSFEQMPLLRQLTSK